MEVQPRFLRRHQHRNHRSVLLVLVAAVLLSLARLAAAQTDAGDAATMRTLVKALDPSGKLNWSASSDPCTSWDGVRCSSGRVTDILVSNRGISGSLPPDVRNLSALIRLELMINKLSGPLPSLAGLGALTTLFLANNSFSSIPEDFFSGLNSLTNVYLDTNPFAAWTIPSSLRAASGLVNFSANGVNLTGTIPDFLGTDFSSFYHLALAGNSLTGSIPSSFAASPLNSLWLNNQKGSGLSGRIDVIQNMTSLKQLYLMSNSFTGPIPDLSRLENLYDLDLRDNQLTGPVPSSLISLKSLQSIVLTNNLLQGQAPVFPSTVKKVDLVADSERFCLTNGSACDPRVNVLLSIAESFYYPTYLANKWAGNDPCNGFAGITCDLSGNITSVVLQKLGFNGTISPDFQLLPKLQKLVLSGNNLTGTIPSQLTNLKYLQLLDVSNNALWGKVPSFGGNVSVNTAGNPNIGKDADNGGSSGADSSNSGNSDHGGRKKLNGVIMGSIVAAVCGALLIGFLGFCCWKRKKHIEVQKTNDMVIDLKHSGSDTQLLKVAVADIANGRDSGPNIAEPGSMVVSIQLLREVTNNFSEDNILGRGGFGTVYKGELHDGSMIAVKRMETGVTGSKGLNEFKSEISVLTKVRHRNLVSLLGYCLEENERILVYEHMPQGTLSHHLFDWMDLQLNPLEWKKRLTIALDVARGVEYLHSLANQTFIHRDLKPSNILLGGNMRAKVADFGLVRLAPEDNRSIETRLAGTFGYLAPEYAVMGRVTTKADVFSFGVILMELITGKKAIDTTLPEESMHLATWFRRMHLNKDAFQKAIDPNIILDKETFESIKTVANLASHCTMREPHQRPDMAYAVNILSSLAEIWKPTDADSDDAYEIDLETPLPEMLKRWKEFTESSQMDGTVPLPDLSNFENSQNSLPTRPRGFAETFTSANAR